MRYLLFLGAAFAASAPLPVAAQTAPDPGAPDPRRDIIVTASPIGHDRDDTPAIVAKVDAEDILRRGGASIADALSKVPGIAATGFATGASRPIIRGMDATRVRVLEDGTSGSDVSDIGPDHGIPIDPLAARSIEVVRGAGTLRYGSQAIGGVVNVLNNRVPTSFPDKPLSAELNGTYGTVSDLYQGAGLVDVAVGDVALHADAFGRHAGDYDTPTGVQQNSFFRGYGGSVGGSYFFGSNHDSHVGAAVTQYDAQYGIPSDTTFIDMRQTKVMTRSSIALGSGLLQRFNLDGSYANYAHDEKEPEGTIDTTFRNKEYNARGEVLIGALGPVTSSALGVEYQHRAFSAVGEDSSYLFPATMESVAGYLFTDTQVADRLHLEASGRVERVRLNGTPRFGDATVRDFTPVSGAIGALYTVSPAIKLGATFSTTGRAPALTELFARGGHDGPNTFETGDPDLRIERANSLEATLRIRSGGFRFDGSVYSSWFRNYIYGDLTGRRCDDDGSCALDGDGDLRELNYRQQGAHFRGVEGEASYDLVHTPHGVYRFNLLADYTRATLDDGRNVPRIPPYRIGGGLNWTGEKLDAGFNLIYAGRQDRFGAFDTATPGYVALDGQLALRPFASHPNVELALLGQNLTNDTQRLATALNKDEVVMPGRRLMATLRIATN
ncbi:iron complex outermembrane receptor protein [Sphingomonas endophytica]|uniref:Iron complex outermembrane receptor protein n=1 Tax=Sphingomonas endophytica TaxID=869719 RepID=A0A7X0JE15_9SPHN|nr:TonB-dependent receptor [Sphingomonas endophytica]MBB6505042.1 iron complex outermembrane receptor protein [Sphingomonas endophytica]